MKLFIKIIIAKTLLLCASSVLVCGQALAGTRLLPDEGFEYSILESTKGELVAVGSNNNVLRWSSTEGREQRWRFLKIDDNNVHIQSVKNGHFLGIDWTGNVSVYPSNGSKEQKFRLWKLTSKEANEFAPAMYEKYKNLNVDFVTIIESSRNERVAVGSNGNILRWARKTEPSQMFILKRETQSVNPFTTFRNDSIAYKRINRKRYEWTGGSPFTRVVRNPLDGGILLRYTQTTKQASADGCSGLADDPTTLAFSQIFLEACLNHDTNYDAPFLSAFFPNQKSQKSLGHDLADFLFLAHMLQIANRKFEQDLAGKVWAQAVADVWHTGTQVGGTFRDRYSASQTVLEKGGVILIQNRAAYAVVAQLDYTAADGRKISHEQIAPVGLSLVLPISVGARNITFKSWPLGGSRSFSKAYKSPQSLGIIAEGTSLFPSWSQISDDN